MMRIASKSTSLALATSATGCPEADSNPAWTGPWGQHLLGPAASSENMLVDCRQRLKAYVHKHGREHSSRRLFWGWLKAFSDGALGSATALMHEPYSHEPGSTGIATMDMGELRELVANATKACLQVCCPPCHTRLTSFRLMADLKQHSALASFGRFMCRACSNGRHHSSSEHALQVAVHAIGDRAVDEVGSSFQAAAPRAKRPPGEAHLLHRYAVQLFCRASAALLVSSVKDSGG